MKISRAFGLPKTKRISTEAIYAPEIFFMDMQLGRIIDHLKETGEYDNTIIVVISDHGQGLGNHDWYVHRLLYQEQIRQPLIVRIPEGARGLTVPQVVRSIDVMPTVLEVLGLKPPEPIEGISMVGLMEGKREAPRLAYAEALNTIDVHAPAILPEHQKDDLFCMTDGTWKLIYHKHAPENTELYNLKADPREKVNVADKHPKVLARLKAALQQSGGMEVERVEPAEPMDQETLEKLRALGYAGGDK
jgi:arylsulfatase A-like enzyme